jgi:hypothetical protein
MKPLQDPFYLGKKIAESMYKETKNIVIDFHAEATGMLKQQVKKGHSVYIFLNILLPLLEPIHMYRLLMNESSTVRLLILVMQGWWVQWIQLSV